MNFRIPAIIALFLFICAANAIGQQPNIPDLSPCSAGRCFIASNVATALPAVPVRGDWKTEDFKSTGEAVTCSVVKYDTSVAMPILHLLCPGRETFAPLRVHLSLTWKDVSEIPGAMKNMLVDMNRIVKFKSKSGDSRVELTLTDPQATRSLREWVTFTQVNVGLVLPSK